MDHFQTSAFQAFWNYHASNARTETTLMNGQDSSICKQFALWDVIDFDTFVASYVIDDVN